MRRLVLVFLIISFSQVFNQSEPKVRFENFQWKVNDDHSFTMSINYYQNIYNYKDLKMGFVYSPYREFPSLYFHDEKTIATKPEINSFSININFYDSYRCYYFRAFIYKEPIDSNEIYYSEVDVYCRK